MNKGVRPVKKRGRPVKEKTVVFFRRVIPEIAEKLDAFLKQLKSEQHE